MDQLKSALDEVRQICLSQHERIEYLHVNEEARTFLTASGLVKIISYINVVFLERGIPFDHSFDVVDSIVQAAKMCGEFGYSSYKHDSKICEMFYWAKFGV